MAAPMTIGMPDGLDVGAGYTLQVTALNPTTGAVVAGVNVTEMVLEVEGEGDLNSGAFNVSNPILIGASA